MGKVKVLPDKVAVRIAAGEVVERPASVVKELIENSIDAESSQIELEIERGGKTLIRVSDNGMGVEAEDIELIGQRHATSKIIFFEDIDNISTLGFRGEALAGISSVSQFKLTSAVKGREAGGELKIHGGEKKSFTKAGCPPGTTVEVKNLFFNTPARKKFLKSDSTELAHIHKIFIRETLAHPQISFFLRQNKREIVKAPKASDYRERIRQVLGKDLAAEVVALEFKSPPAQISGFIAKPGYTRLDRSHQFFYVNKRWINSPLLSHAVNQGYRSFIEAGRMPVVVIFLEISPGEVDINIHPSKREARFKNERLIHNLLLEIISRTLKNSEPIPSVLGREEEKKIPEEESKDSWGHFYKTGAEEKKEGIKEAVNQFLIKEEPAQFFESKDLFAAGDCLQIRKSYILYYDSEGLYIIDQHAAHERVLFEQLKDNKSTGIQNLLIPVKMEVSAEEAVLFKKFKKVLGDFGFEIEHFGGQSFIIRSLPAIFKKVDPKPLVYDLLDELKKNSTLALVPEEKIYRLIACHSAVRQGDKLSKEELSALVKDWKKTKQPFNCPHGRPVVIKLSWKELEKKFKRH